MCVYLHQKEVGLLVHLQMNFIFVRGGAFQFDRTLSEGRQAFLRNYVEAQIANFEGSSFSGWFFWNFKVEGGTFAEWDFLRGLREGWVPKLPEPDVSAADVYGSCFEILFRTDDNITNVIDEFPDTPPDIDGLFNDDIVTSHGTKMRKVFGKWYDYRHKAFKVEIQNTWVAAFFLVAGFIMYKRMKGQKKSSYTKIPE
jgi:glucan 1,3-beta-glucosidase